MIQKIILLVLLAGVLPATYADTEKALFAGGCFWCMEPPFDKLDGVISTVSGYAGGETENPTYEEVTSGKTGHFEVVEVTYDPKTVSYETLLKIFWTNIDPENGKGQFCDRGSQYLSAIFYLNDEQRAAARNSISALIDSNILNDPIATRILPASKFYPAEEYHQDYYLKNPARYRYYRNGCGRDTRLKRLWNNVELPF
ncbi:MAG: peptide-methionine (S)-S-oxide reductase [Porticoccus sp.]|jgi:peptide-methionine (S)-S-oxide reductase|uniref:peptide-methionine (S)-S-oxide reductase MsrA n=1 Tax=Porticoccus hydrocarbonoclasticus TaxID=1073414 RepID=UPI000C4F1C4B|nr:peptide-methionine (S)-S-oxide reductase MsrA [Porticoccus hydrocarbonoclasticus]MBG57914.1 peptide-methionine (S)-S-oxide reductase [Porticoccus sp.]|tara:strand:- start:16354 stop:16950 length:597 start_codon:yes stop_codon:yes gene_type:complete